MTEQDKLNSNKGQNELTNKPNSFNLKREGDIFMPEPGGEETAPVNPTESQISKPKITMHDSLEKRQEAVKERFDKENQGRTVSFEEKQTQKLIIEHGILPIEGGSDDQPSEKISDELKDYIIKSREGASIGITNNLKRILKENGVSDSQIEYFENHPDEFRQSLEIMLSGSEEIPEDKASSEEKPKLNTKEDDVQGIIENAEDFYSAVEKLIITADEKVAKKAIDNAGEDVLSFYTEGLGLTEKTKYTDELKEIKGLSEGEIRERFVDILEKIKNERISQGLSDPFAEEAAKQPVVLSKEDKGELERLQKESEEKSQVEREKRHFNSDAIEAASKRLEDLKNMNEGRITHSVDEQKSVNREDLEDEERVFDEAYFTDINNIINILNDQSLDSEAKIAFLQGNDELMASILDPNAFSPEELPRMQEILKKIFSDEDKNKAINELKILIPQVKEKYRNKRDLKKRELGANGGYEDYDYMNSLEDVANFIANKINKDLYGPEGIYPLIKEDGTINQSNFLIFARDTTLGLHEGNVNDPISPLEQIVLEGRLRAINLIMMVKRNRRQYFYDKTAGRVLDELADETLTETWAFGVIRNTGLAYKQVMNSDTDLPKAIPQFHLRSDLTRGNTLETMLSAPDDFEKGDTKVGDATRFANDFYYNISDKDQLIDVLGKNQFTQEDFLNALRLIQGKKDWEDVDDYAGYYDKQEGRFFYQAKQPKLGEPKDKGKVYLFDQNGNIDMSAFVNSLNFYNENTAKESLVGFVRELVRIKAAQKYGLKSGISFSQEEKTIARNSWNEKVNLELDKRKNDPKNQGKTQEELLFEARQQADKIFIVKRNAQRINLKWAETAAYEMQRPYGAAARNDMNRRGFDAATKLFIRDYLTRQSGENTAGPIGIPEEIPIFKTLGVDMWQGLRTESGLSPYKIFQELRAIEDSNRTEEEKNKLKKEWRDKLKFRDKAESEFAGNQTANAFDIFHSLSDAKNLDLNQVVSYSFLEGVKFNPQKFEEMINDGFIKPMRYAFSSNSGLDFSSEVRWHDYAETKRINAERKDLGLEPIAPIYKTVTLAEAMFSNEVLNSYYKTKNGEEKNLLEGLNSRDKEALEFIDSSEGRVRVVKNIARARIAAQIRFHRKFGSTGEYWGYNRTEIFLDALKTMREYELDPENPDRVKQTSKSFFTKEDIEWIRKNGSADVWKMVLADTLREGAPALGSGIWKGMAIFVQALRKAQ